MFWLTRPPYLRRILAAAILVTAAVWDLLGRRTEPFPFAATDIPAGEAVAEELIDWRPVPAGMLALPDLAQPIAARAIASGEPLLPSSIGGEGPIPEDWWAVPVALPATALPGTEVRLVLFDPPLAVDGIVVASGERDLLSISDAGLVAVPAEAAESVARAAIDGEVAILVRP